MKISKPLKIIIGLLTAWVVITPLLFFGAWIFFIFSVAATQNQPSANWVPLFIFPLIALVIITSILHVIMQAFYLVHIILNKAGTDVMRAILGVGMIFLAILAMPVYYFIYIFPENPPQWSVNPGTPQVSRPSQESSPNPPPGE